MAQLPCIKGIGTNPLPDKNPLAVFTTPDQNPLAVLPPRTKTRSMCYHPDKNPLADKFQPHSILTRKISKNRTKISKHRTKK